MSSSYFGTYGCLNLPFFFPSINIAFEALSGSNFCHSYSPRASYDQTIDSLVDLLRRICTYQGFIFRLILKHTTNVVSDFEAFDMIKIP